MYYKSIQEKDSKGSWRDLTYACLSCYMAWAKPYFCQSRPFSRIKHGKYLRSSLSRCIIYVYIIVSGLLLVFFSISLLQSLQNLTVICKMFQRRMFLVQYCLCWSIFICLWASLGTSFQFVFSEEFICSPSETYQYSVEICSFMFL